MTARGSSGTSRRGLGGWLEGVNRKRWGRGGASGSSGCVAAVGGGTCTAREGKKKKKVE